ncbi:MAG TPA: FHA domain-containing protein [Myxococcus sp.]|nr:FHA domain-containing protein [Myxococcus sp.]
MPSRPPPSSRAGTGRSGGRAGADSPSAKNSPRNRPGRAPAEDEDFAAPLSGEEGYPEDGPPNPELYGDAGDDEDNPRTGETRVGSVSDIEQEAAREVESDDNPDATRAGPPVQILVLNGPDRGRKKRFQSVRMVVGRGKDCDFVLEDQTVSRRHLELVYGDGGVVMRDLGSVAGTQVNDQKVDECALKHGDEISVGKTRLRFVDEAEQLKELRAQAEAREAEEKKEREEAAREAEEAKKAAAAKGKEADPADPQANQETNARYDMSGAQSKGKGAVAVARSRPAPDAGKGKGKLILGLVAVVVMLLAVGFMLRPKGPPPPPPVDPAVVQAQALMQKAREASRVDDYAAVIRWVESAEQLVPGIDKEGLAATAKNAQAVQEALGVARGLLEENKFSEARAKLASAPKGPPKVEGERQRLEAELDQRELAWNIQRVEEALSRRLPDQVRPLLELLPPEQRTEYELRLEELEQELEQEERDELRRNRNARERAAVAAREKRKAFIEEAFVEVERHFNGGQYQRAVLECDRVVDKHSGDKEIRDRANNLKRLIPQFQRVMGEAEAKLAQRALEPAVKPLRRASELYGQIGFKGSLGRAIDENLATAAVAAGQSALKRGDLASAGTSFREAQRLNPGDGRARDGLDSLQKKAAELLREAYIQRDRDPQGAAEKLKVVIETAADGSETKRKAEMYLGELQE